MNTNLSFYFYYSTKRTNNCKDRCCCSRNTERSTMREHDNSAASIVNPIGRIDQHALQTSMALFASPALREST